MRTIERQAPPACLASQPKGQTWEAFMGTDCHVALADSLCAEQHGLCCYCESEIRSAPAESRDCHVEHMAPRQKNPARTYDYANLASSCNGGDVEHCGHFKDNRDRNPDHPYNAALFCTPHDPGTAALFKYLIDGTVAVADGADASQAQYMLDYLGLNCARLQERRKTHARRLLDTLGRTPDDERLACAQTYYLELNGERRLQPFHSLSQAILKP